LCNRSTLIEILRSTLRWATRLERAEIQRLLGQCNALREEVMRLSRRERFAQSSAAPVDLEPLRPAQSPTTGQRRAALLERDFVFEGVFGDNPKLLETLEITEKAAPTDLPVLIRGEICPRRCAPCRRRLPQRPMQSPTPRRPRR